MAAPVSAARITPRRDPGAGSLFMARLAIVTSSQTFMVSCSGIQSDQRADDQANICDTAARNRLSTPTNQGVKSRSKGHAAPHLSPLERPRIDRVAVPYQVEQSGLAEL